MILFRTLPPTLPKNDQLPPPESPFDDLSRRRMWGIYIAKQERELRGRLGWPVTIMGSRN